MSTQQPVPATQQAPQQSCPTCAALARTVMCDQVSFDRKPDCYGIRQLTDDEGVEEWEDIRTSPDVAREEADDMMATGRGEIYEVVPLWTTPQPAPATQQAGATKEHVRLVRVIADKIEDGTLFQSGIYSNKDLARFVRNVADAAAPQPSPVEQNESAYQRGYMDGMAKGRRDVDAAPQQSGVGDSAFESWYSTYSPVHKSDKQRACDAYAAGMGDPLVTPAPQARAIEAEVRKQDEALIRQLVDALEYHRAQTRPIELTDEAITAGRARLEGKP